LNENVYGTAVGYNAKSDNYSTSTGSGTQETGYCGMSIGTNCLNATNCSTSIKYNKQSEFEATSLGYSA
jgi:hypothetical protein